MITRRSFMQGMMGAGSMVAAVTAFPKMAFAWAENAFTADNLTDAQDAMFSGSSAVDSGRVKLKAPQIAENGAVVPITISSDLANVTNISVFVEKNPTPLSASFELNPMLVPEVSVRIRMGKTSNIIAVVKADGKLYKASQEVKVTIGGCGG